MLRPQPTLYPKPDEKLQQHLGIYYYNGVPAYYGYDPATIRDQHEYSDYMHQQQQQAAQEAAYASQFYPAAPPASYALHHPVATGLRHNSTGATLLTYNELDYFEQFLGGLAPDAKVLQQLQHQGTASLAQINSDSVLMNPIMVNHLAAHKKHRRSGSLGSTASVSSTATTTAGRSSTKPLLDADTKRAHHIASEHKRRGRIRNELVRLSDMVPELQGSSKSSQSKILSGAADFLEKVMGENARLRAEIAALKNQAAGAALLRPN